MRANRFACAALLGLAATAHGTCHLSEDNRSLTVLEGESCSIEVNSVFDNIVSVGTVEIAEDVVVGAESFYSRNAILRDGAKLMGSTLNAHDGNFLFGDNVSVEFEDAINIDGESVLNAGSNVVFTSPSINFAVDTTLNGIEFGAFAEDLVGDATTYTLPTVQELAAYSAEKLRDIQFRHYNCEHNLQVANAELQATEALRANVNATVRYLASSLFTTQAEASTCKNVVVEVRDTLTEVYDDLTVATEEARECVEEKIVLVENYNTCTEDLTNLIESAPPAIPAGLDVPPYVVSELPAVPGNLVFKRSLYVASSSAITAADIDDLNAAVVDIVAHQLGLESEQVTAAIELDGTENADVTISIAIPPNQTGQFVLDTNARLTKYSDAIFFAPLASQVPSFTVATKPVPVADPEEPAAPSSPATPSSGPGSGLGGGNNLNNSPSIVKDNKQSAIIGAVAGVGGLVVGAVAVAVFAKFQNKGVDANSIAKLTSNNIGPKPADGSNFNFQIYNPLDGNKTPAAEPERRVSFVPTGTNSAAKNHAPNVNVSVMSLPESAI